MTAATPLLNAERMNNEGWLDTAARLERERGLTPDERAEVEAAWRAFCALMGEVAAAFRDGSPGRRAFLRL